MLVGYPPFFSDNPTETCQKIIKWKQYFKIPSDATLSIEAENLIRRLMSTSDNRLGLGGAAEIKKHPFFRGLDWESIRKVKPPFLPNVKIFLEIFIFQLTTEWDTKYFDTFAEQEPFYPPEKKQKKRKDINYPGYTYNRDLDNHKSGLLQALEVLDAVKRSTQNIDEVKYLFLFKIN